MLSLDFPKSGVCHNLASRRLSGQAFLCGFCPASVFRQPGARDHHSIRGSFPQGLLRKPQGPARGLLCKECGPRRGYFWSPVSFVAHSPRWASKILPPQLDPTAHWLCLTLSRLLSPGLVPLFLLQAVSGGWMERRCLARERI